MTDRDDQVRVVTMLPTPRAEAQQSVINIAEEILAKASSGEIIELCAVVIYSDNHLGTFANQTEHRTRRIGSVAQLLHDLTSSQPEYIK